MSTNDCARSSPVPTRCATTPARRNAEIAEPVQRTVGGKVRYVSCLHFYPRESDGTYHEMRERAVAYVNGRLDRLVENASEVCAGAVYAPFPEMEKMQR